MANLKGTKANLVISNDKAPAHELVIKITDPDENVITLKASLFSQNNDGHEFIANLTNEQLAKLISNYAELTIQEAGKQEDKPKRSFGFAL